MANSEQNLSEATASRYDYQAFQILRFGFTVAPIIAGADKFFHLLVNWDQYLPGFVNNLVGATVTSSCSRSASSKSWPVSGSP